MSGSLIKGVALYTAILLIAPMIATSAQAIYGYYTHHWDPLVSYVSAVTGSFVISSGAVAASQGIAWGAAAASIAAKLTPWGWAILAGIGIGL